MKSNNIQNVNDIEVIEDSDPRFLTDSGQKSFDVVKNINGKTYAYRNSLTKLMALNEKSASKEGL